MAEFIITTKAPAMVNGQPNPEGTIPASKRESRAIAKARTLRAQGNQDVMLFRHDSKRGYLPISLKYKTYVPGTHAEGVGHNTTVVGTFEPDFAHARSLNGRPLKIGGKD